MSASYGKGTGMKKVANNRAREIRSLQRMKDAEIDLSDIPEIKGCSAAVAGRATETIQGLSGTVMTTQ